jgi:hypothetical protein
MQALNSSQTNINSSISSASSSNSNSSVDDTHEHNNSGIMESSVASSSSVMSETGMILEQPHQHCYHIENGSTSSVSSSQQAHGISSSSYNNNTIAINNNNCDTIKNNNQQTLTAPLEMVNDAEATVPTVALIDQHALLRGVNIGNIVSQFRVIFDISQLFPFFSDSWHFGTEETAFVQCNQ